MERRKVLSCMLGVVALAATPGKVTAAEEKTPKYTPWIGDLDRSKIAWKPTINSKLCGGCGMCMSCGAKVFSWVEKKPVVAQPDKCIVGCTTCMNMCPKDAITFPPKASVTKVLKEEKVYGRIKSILQVQGKIPKIG